MKFTPLIQELIDSFKILPGVGPKSAQRMAFQLLEQNQTGAARLAKALQTALSGICKCKICRNFSEQENCPVCSELTRVESGQVCVVATPSDVLAIEETGHYHGRYFVLMGLLSPLDGVGPEELGLDLLAQQLSAGQISELILATPPSIEGDATAYYITDMAKDTTAKVSQLAQGVPMGGDISNIDSRTLGHAFSGRKFIEQS
ncbi:recombination mediator RecR [Catenovulum maritimum]|uniref:Recombination protein RecR n=1 Tax=Catenovulum maritimum TaxID=1513271 RepID=A0A0J8GXB1_9ALTE|nr:recombination mediator RecR [Catenovulum maritimum]KMT65884.1 recombination protein RecR [Catenovulum maritimum]